MWSKDVTVPARSRIVNNIQGKSPQQLLRISRELLSVPGWSQVMTRDREPGGLGGEFARKNVDLVTMINHRLREIRGPRLLPASPRIESTDDNSDSHKCRFRRAAGG